MPEGRAFIDADGPAILENVGQIEYGRMVFVAQMIQEMRLLRAEFPGERVVSIEGHFLVGDHDQPMGMKNLEDFPHDGGRQRTGQIGPGNLHAESGQGFRGNPHDVQLPFFMAPSPSYIPSRPSSVVHPQSSILIVHPQ